MKHYDNHFSHLTLEDRQIIRTGIFNGSSKAAIAKTLGKDKSTIGKEIKNHRKLSSRCSLPLECAAYKHCKHGRLCTTQCPDFKPFKCTRRDRSPGACNGCSLWSKCHFNKFTYEADFANEQYRENPVNSRVGVNLTYKEAKAMANIIAPLIKQGQSPYQIVTNHPELGICEKTLYNYIEGGVFANIGNIIPLDLRRQVSRKIPKNRSNMYKKREDRKFLQGRQYSDYKAYIADNEDAYVTQMDTVYNKESGPFIQTFRFLQGGFFFALLQSEKTAAAMSHGIDVLESILGKDIFHKYVNVLLTDRGSEFSDPDSMETDADGTLRTRVFYCDPMRSNQKGSLENKHHELRYFLPKGVDFYEYGLHDQSDLNLILSHINSMPLEKLGGKTALEVIEFFYPDLYEKVTAFGIKKIEKDHVILKPELLKNR